MNLNFYTTHIFLPRQSYFTLPVSLDLYILSQYSVSIIKAVIILLYYGQNGSKPQFKLAATSPLFPLGNFVFMLFFQKR